MRKQLSFSLVLAALIFSFFLALCAGHVWDSPRDVIYSVFGKGREFANLIYLWRLPRVITALLVGFLLGLSGTIFQGIFRNPLAEPWLVGSSGGAAVGATLALLLPWPLSQEIVLPLFSFIGALSAAFLVLSLARISGSLDTSTLLLAGIAVSAILTSVRSFLMMTLSTESISLQVVMSWLMGAIQAPSGAWMWSFLGLGLLLFLLSMTLAHPLDLLGLGENMALAYGLKVKKILIWGLVMGAATAALAVSVGGLVAFVGLAAPHIGRFFVGTRHRYLIPFSALTGAVIVTLADTLSRSLLPPGEIPLGLITAICGGPFFLFLLARKSR
ncbi:MAG: iron ABC transporter permease [Deltaproteobacteria bacterium]|jgi:iron complex transport system permease protein|nr:iron ABC transporter permease [Deltaproteobacteria bacterium]